MKLLSLVNQHRWLFAGVVFAPIFVQIAILFAGYNSLNLVTIAVCLSSIIAGIIVASGLVLTLHKWDSFSQVHAIVFTVAWTVVFGYLNVFSFLMGMDSSMPEGSELVAKIAAKLLMSTPMAALVSLFVCAALTAFALLVTKMASSAS